MRAFDIVLLLLLLGVLGFSTYLLVLNIPGKEVEYGSFSASPEMKNYSYLSDISHQFYPNMRYRTREISYMVEDVCSEQRKRDVMNAFSILSEKTMLQFYPVDENADIIALCSEMPREKEAEEKGHFIAGEGGASKVINASVFSIIIEGKVSLYREEKCDKPNIAIHEILHALGFDHNNNTKSVLYPVTSCEQEIDDYLIEEINRLYIIEEAPDLAIENIKANRSGMYLNYVITIANYGLKESMNATLRVYSGEYELTNYDLGKVDLGMKRIITATNVRVRGNSDKIVFVIMPKSSEKDLNVNNNRAEIVTLE